MNCLLIGLAVLGWTCWQTWCGYRTLNYRAIQGVVRECRIEKTRSFYHTYLERRRSRRNEFNYELVIAYNYFVDGTAYVGNRVSLINAWNRPDLGRNAIVSRFPKGTVVKVYFDPDKPEESVLIPGCAKPYQQLMFYVGALFLTVSGGLKLRQVLKDRPPKSPGLSKPDLPSGGRLKLK